MGKNEQELQLQYRMHCGVFEVKLVEIGIDYTAAYSFFATFSFNYYIDIFEEPSESWYCSMLIR